MLTRHRTVTLPFRWNRVTGVSLIETVVSLAVFFIIAASVYQAYATLIAIVTSGRTELLVTYLANEQMEVIKNMPYENIGTVDGMPSGTIAATSTVMRDRITFSVAITIRNIDDPFDGTLGGDPNDTAPADYKLVHLSFICISCPDQRVFSFTDRIAPRWLETSGNGGALFVRAIDANGHPVANATVQVTRVVGSPTLSVTDTTDTNGYLKLIDIPAAASAYRIIVSKDNYSTDRTYAADLLNPNPAKPDATVAAGEVTQLTFAIDQVSTLQIFSINDSCNPLGNTSISLTGTKLIGENLPKFSEMITTPISGSYTLTNVEWDLYTISFSQLQNPTLDLIGNIPLSQFDVTPASTQDLSIVVHTKQPKTLLVGVRDSITLLPLSGAMVKLVGLGYSNTHTTGRGSLTHTAWEPASPEQYQDGNIETGNPAGELKLKIVATSTYAANGWLINSFDAGSVSNFYTINWNPEDQHPATGQDPVKLQLSSSTTSPPTAQSAFVGPDGTANTYYTLGNREISEQHNGNRYLAYKLYFTTASTSFTPNISDISVVFASNCTPPGQTYFSNLTQITYTLTVSLAGYETYSESISVQNDWQAIDVRLDQSGTP